MARFKSNSLYLKDNQKIVFGTISGSNLYFSNSELQLDTVISGVDPIQAHHLTTKYYVDGLISTLSGSIDDHNELNNIQGGDIDDYYHLTLVQHTDLTDGGDSTIHHHDGRYYTETEVDAAFVTFSGTIDHDTILNTHNLTTDIDHDLLTNFASDEHFTEASIDHGNITGLGDDDHVQYSLVNGLRAFTATISGVIPTLDAHLATKGYVDSVSVDKVQSDRVGLSINDTEKAVIFDTPFGDTDYTISVILSTTDDPASIYSMIITNKANTGFTAVFSGDIIASGYTLEWLVRHD